MRRALPWSLCALALLAPTTVAGQVGITPRIGVYVQAGDFDELTDEVDDIEVSNEAALALGATLDIGRLYLSVDYVTGSTLSDDGIQDDDDVGDGSLLAIAGGLVFRARSPVIQPHLRVGAGVKRHDYSFDDDELENLLPDDLTDFALHAAVGATVGLGGLGLAFELGDYITVDGFKPHDLMLTAGLRLGF